MDTSTHQEKCDIAYDDGGRPTVSITLYNQADNITVPDGFDNILIDTGAVVTSINKAFADENNYPIIKYRELVLMGFNDIGRAMKALNEFMSKEEASVYLKSFADRGKDLVDALERDYGIKNIGLVFDLRKISYDGHYECLFFKVETSGDNIVYPSEMQSGFVYNSEKGLYLAYTDIGIWRIDPQTQDAEKITSDYYNGENLYELRDAQGAINFYWIDGVRLSPDGAYAVYRTTRDCTPGGETSVWCINLTTGEEYQAVAPNINNDIIGFISNSHIMVGALADSRIVDIISNESVPVSFPELPNFSVKAVGHGVAMAVIVALLTVTGCMGV